MKLNIHQLLNNVHYKVITKKLTFPLNFFDFYIKENYFKKLPFHVL